MNMQNYGEPIMEKGGFKKQIWVLIVRHFLISKQHFTLIILYIFNLSVIHHSFLFGDL